MWRTYIVWYNVHWARDVGDGKAITTLHKLYCKNNLTSDAVVSLVLICGDWSNIHRHSNFSSLLRGFWALI